MGTLRLAGTGGQHKVHWHPEAPERAPLVHLDLDLGGIQRRPPPRQDQTHQRPTPQQDQRPPLATSQQRSPTTSPTTQSSSNTCII